ncbi:hypothetical protein EFK50_00165 [Nocardioides marmoriginsengisoli]|uniref:NAD glycohydrolase translocation F5/8 type C domain-containing protein n=1 Tax=Nocardioides marmoriginsengisoli TaxID=661483 RepID=A0A3N0CSW9_9ACTN|nr:hypothetical protein [Nocardioides marmoriginsengisoli]RNL66086.1 hypothetical protein EFK50_00165 [Nocardioides marmoriginsengisoli]
MSGIDDSGSPPEVPEEYAAVYRDAYLRALAEDAESPVEPAADAAATEPEAGGPDPERASWRRPLLAAVVVLAVIGGAFAVVQALSGDDEPSIPRVSEPRSTSPAPGRRPGTQQSEEPAAPESTEATPSSTDEPAWDGEVEPVGILGAEATCTADPGVDSAGDPVRYTAANAVDGDPATAWRCDGRAIGETLTFTLPPDTEVAEVGLIPGYAKTDASSGADRYAENNRITRVRWTLADGVVVEQKLDPSPDDRSVQRIRVPRTETGEITVEVLGAKRGPRNTTAISEVEVSEAD